MPILRLVQRAHTAETVSLILAKPVTMEAIRTETDAITTVILNPIGILTTLEFSVNAEMESKRAMKNATLHLLETIRRVPSSARSTPTTMRSATTMLPVTYAETALSTLERHATMETQRTEMGVLSIALSNTNIRVFLVLFQVDVESVEMDDCLSALKSAMTVQRMHKAETDVRLTARLNSDGAAAACSKTDRPVTDVEMALLHYPIVNMDTSRHVTVQALEADVLPVVRLSHTLNAPMIVTCSGLYALCAGTVLFQPTLVFLKSATEVF